MPPTKRGRLARALTKPVERHGFATTYWTHSYGDRSQQFWGGIIPDAVWLELYRPRMMGHRSPAYAAVPAA